MKWANVKWIFLREVRDQLRDRRTLFTIVVLPLLLYPLLGMSFLQVAQFSREHSTSVLVLGAASLPESPQLIERSDGESGRFDETFCPESEARLLSAQIKEGLPEGTTIDGLRAWAEKKIQSGVYDVVVYFPDDFAENLNAFRSRLSEEQGGSQDIDEPAAIPEPELFLNSASDKSRIARDRVANVLRRWRETIVDKNLRDRHIPKIATRPFQLVDTDVARERSRRAAVWSKILPFVVLIWALTGAFYPAIDLCAGEKERGTLETLLCSPAQRGEIVWGKLLTVMTFSMTTAVLNLLSMGLTGLFIITRIAEMGGATRLAIGAPPLAAIGWLVLALIPLSALFSALSLAIAAFARSSKEGQYYLMPLLMITLPLMMLPMMPSAELDLGMSLIPVTGVMLLLRSLIEGQYIEALRYAVPVLGVTSICCLLAIRWAVDQFNNESVLFRESERWGLGIWVRHLVRERSNTPSLGEAIFCGVLLLVIRFFAAFLVGMPEDWSGFATTTVVSLVAFIAAPALLMAIVLTRRPAQSLLLRRPRAVTIPMAVLLAILLHPAGVALGNLVKWIYPYSPDVEVQLQSFGFLIEQAPSIWSILLVLALVPAICEELAFRGFILSGLRHMGHKWAAIFATSVFFGATHGVLQQSLAAGVVGIVLGYLAVQTGSLLPSVLFHIVYNSLTLLMAVFVPSLLQDYPAIEWVFAGTAEGPMYQWPAIGVCFVLGLFVLRWFQCLPYEHTAEETLQEALDHQTAGVPAK
jgi:sodium transport system permease protein